MSTDNIIEHQFLHSNFFLPTWRVHTLVLGTFNPVCGTNTDYFYGRIQNNFWRTIEKLHNLDNNWFQDNYERKQKFMVENEFGCTDIIKSIKKSDEVEIKEICGSGYSDQILFTIKKCTLSYHFEEIKNFILNNNVKKIINTWGKRNKPNHFKNQIIELKKFCLDNGVLYIEDCPSPSGRIRSKKQKELLYNFYELHLTK